VLAQTPMRRLCGRVGVSQASMLGDRRDQTSRDGARKGEAEP
jgi:hypothetical protein